MLFLPILNVHLHACPADWHQMAPTTQGRHCAHCNREVIDFTNSTAADLAAARTASPDGQLCSRFRQSQLAAGPQPRLRSKLRRFLVALVLVCGLGLSGREAWAQVLAGTKRPEAAQTFPPGVLGMSPEKMPEYKNGGTEGLRRFITHNLRYPPGQQKSGRVFIGFVVTKQGYARRFSILKGMGEPFDREALHVLPSLWDNGFRLKMTSTTRYLLPFLDNAQSTTQTKK